MIGPSENSEAGQVFTFVTGSQATKAWQADAQRLSIAQGRFDQMTRIDGRLPNESAALKLLERSIFYDHPDLAVIRLSIAVDVGARVPDAAWRYCRQAAHRSADPGLRTLFEAASQRHAHRHGGTP